MAIPISPVPQDLFNLGHRGRWFEDLRQRINALSVSGGLDHTLLSNIGTNTHTQIDTALATALSHRSDGTLHFTEGSIDHTAITNIGSNSHSAIDTHIADGTIHFTEGSIDHTAITNIGTNTHATIDTHIADATIHFTEGSIDHTAITNIGTNTHAQIDTHIADATLHFTEGSIDHTAITNIGTNTHSDIDTHIADTSLHSTEAAGSDEWIQFNTSDELDAVTKLRWSTTFDKMYIGGDLRFESAPEISNSTGDITFSLAGSTSRLHSKTNGANSVVSSFNNNNTNTGSSAGSGILLSAGTITSFIGGLASQRLDASANSRTAIRVLSGSSLTATSSSAAFFIEGSTSSGVKGRVTGQWEVIGTNNVLQSRVKGVGSQTANLQEWQDSVSTVLGYVSSAGTLGFSGGLITAPTRVTTTYTILVTDYVVFSNTDGGAYTVTLPAGASGQTYRIVNTGDSGNDLTIDPDGSEHLIGVNSSFTLADGEALEISYDSTDGWY